jgi:hypothetical protein
MSGLLMEQLHLVKGLDPVANAFAGTVYSQAVAMKDWNRATFVRYDGVGATGTSTITVQACSSAAGANPVAIPFRYREILATDVEGALTAVAATGYTSTAGSSKLIEVEVRADDLAALALGYVRLKCVESAASPVLGGILVIMGESRNRTAIAPTVVA